MVGGAHGVNGSRGRADGLRRSVTSPPFELDPRIAQSSAPLAKLALCEARLQLDARWPWLVLIPRRPDLVEIEQLGREDRVTLMEETILAGRAVRAVSEALGRPIEKLNIGALGNIVAQLHVHVIGRRTDDPAWPGPVWGVGEARRYDPAELSRAITAARAALDG